MRPFCAAERSRPCCPCTRRRPRSRTSPFRRPPSTDRRARQAPGRAPDPDPEPAQRPVSRHQRRAPDRLARRGAADAAADGAVPLRRLAIKPCCDGTHAGIGFTDAKDPDRVPDRRDTYVGQQVTVLDNRGICQHSGLLHRSAGDGVPCRTGAVRRSQRRAHGRDHPRGAGLPVRRAQLRDRRRSRPATRSTITARREPAIEVSKDGPYRVTGGDPADRRRRRRPSRAPQGASREHYALCRCGQSQNKPFCSGMHWYVDFQDPVPDPTASRRCSSGPAGCPR